jgi:hypothetical protein
LVTAKNVDAYMGYAKNNLHEKERFKYFVLIVVAVAGIQ